MCWVGENNMTTSTKTSIFNLLSHGENNLCICTQIIFIFFKICIKVFHGGHFNKKLPLDTGAIKKVYEGEVLYSAFPIKQPLQEQHLASFSPEWNRCLISVNPTLSNQNGCCEKVCCTWSCLRFQSSFKDCVLQ